MGLCSADASMFPASTAPVAQRKLKHVIEKSSMTTQLIIIGVLIVILILLLVLAIY